MQVGRAAPAGGGGAGHAGSGQGHTRLPGPVRRR